MLYLRMPTAASTTTTTATATTALAPSILRRLPAVSPSTPPRLPPPTIGSGRLAIRSTSLPASGRRGISCQVALTTEVPSSSSASEEETEAAAKVVGARVRVKAPLRVYHVGKAPELDLCGMEGAIKQYVGVWKGKRISANLPFKVEFLLPVDGQPAPVKFFAHLKEDEFEYLASSD